MLKTNAYDRDLHKSCSASEADGDKRDWLTVFGFRYTGMVRGARRKSSTVFLPDLNQRLGSV